MEGTGVYLQVGLGSTFREGGSETGKGRGPRQGELMSGSPLWVTTEDPWDTVAPCAFQFPPTVG